MNTRSKTKSCIAKKRRASFNKRIKEAVNECKKQNTHVPSFKVYESTEDVDDIEGLDLSLLRDANDLDTGHGTCSGKHFVQPPINFAQEWAKMDSSLYNDENSRDSVDTKTSNDSMDSVDSVDSVHSVDSVDSMISMDSIDSVPFSDKSGAQDTKPTECKPKCNIDALWCHESHVEDVPGHAINTSALSLLDLLAMKHTTVGGARSLKIQIAGGVIGERFHYSHDIDGKPIPLYVNCASVRV